MEPKLSLIIAFYNKVEYLKLLFSSLERQTFREFEVIIADDGSNSMVVKEVLQMSKTIPFPVRHIWHEDIGWRKNIILNKAIMAASSDYLVFIDGDCFLHRHFLKEHYNHRKPKQVLVGRRVNLSREISESLTSEKIKSGYLERFGTLIQLFIHKVRKSGSHVENGIYIPSGWIRTLINRKERSILGSNFSVFKSDLLSINGFDERYLAPAVGEDNDIDFRFSLTGVKNRSLKHIAIQYHIYHKTLDRPEQNLKIYRQTVANKIWFTPYGIDKVYDNGSLFGSSD